MKPTGNGKKGKRSQPAILLPVDAEFRAKTKAVSGFMQLPVTEFIRRLVHQNRGSIVDLLRQRVEADARAFVVFQAKEFFRAKRKGLMPWSELKKRQRHEAFVAHVDEAVDKINMAGLLKNAHEAGKAFSVTKPKPDDWGEFEFHDFTGDPKYARAILGLTGYGERDAREARESKWRSDLNLLNSRLAEHWRGEVILCAHDLGIPQPDGNSSRPRTQVMQLKGTFAGNKYEIGVPNPLNPERSVALGPRHLQALNALLSFVDHRQLEAEFGIRVETFAQRFPERDGVQLLDDLFDSWVELAASDNSVDTTTFGEIGVINRAGRSRPCFRFSRTTAKILRSVTQPP